MQQSRILFINYDKRWGGGQEYLRILIRSLLETKDYIVGQLFQPGSTSEKRFSQEFSQETNYLGRAIKRNNFIQLFRNLRLFDIVHIHREHDLWLGVLAKLFNPKLKLFYSIHLKPQKKRLLVKFCDVISCNSTFTAKAFEELYKKKAEVIYPCVTWDEKLTLQKIPIRGKPSILMSAAFYKNQTELVEIFHELIKQKADAHLYFIGPSQDKGIKELILKIESLGLAGSITILPSMPREEYLSFLKSVDFFAYTYEYEPFGMAVLEAALMNKPIIAYSAGGVTEILKHYTKARLIQPGDRLSFVNALLQSPEAEANSANSFMQKFSLENFLFQHKKIYEALLNKGLEEELKTTI